jgi:hypothetical protein
MKFSFIFLDEKQSIMRPTHTHTHTKEITLLERHLLVSYVQVHNKYVNYAHPL